MRKDYTGIRCGHLVAVRSSNTKNKNRSVLWVFECDCGNEKITKQDCYYCGEHPSLVYSIKANDTGDYIYNGIDRVDNAKGYEIGNVVPCCGMCNKLKSNFNLSSFLSKIENIYKKHSSTVSLLRSEI